MGVLNGILGAVAGTTAVGTVRAWEVSTSAELAKLVASNTKGGPIRLIGNTDWSGSYRAYGHSPVLLPGYMGSFLGSVDGAKGVEGNIIVDGVEVSIDVEGAGGIEHTVNFSGDDALNLDAVAVVDDVSDPAAFPSVGLGASVCAPGEEGTPASWIPIAGIRTMTISLSAENVAYNTSNTGGKTRRLKGNIDASAGITVYEGDLGLHTLPNTLKALRIFVSATEYWEFKWVFFREVSGIEVNREDASFIGGTLNAEFSGFTTLMIGGPEPPAVPTVTQGHILLPDGLTYFFGGA